MHTLSMYFFFRMPERKRYQKEKGTVCIMPERKRYQKEKGTVCIFEATTNAFLPKGQELAALKQPVLFDGSLPFLVLRL